MRHRKIILLLAVVLLVLGLWWLLRVLRPAPDTRSQAADELASSEAVASSGFASPALSGDEQQKKEVIGKVVQAYHTPIAFYGRVVDQYGEPVAGANVIFAPIYSLMSNKTSYTGTSDDRGYFSIENIKGIALSVGVRKEGYYFIDGQSSATFAYGIGTDAYRKSPPTKDKPAVFVLYKMGKTAPLVRVEQSARIPKDGTPATVDLMSGRLSPSGNLRVEAWTEAPVEGRKFTWRCCVTIPGGGLVERKGQFDFEAPEDGYEESVELGMSGDAEQWTSQQQRDYFVKLPDGRFARVSFTMIAGGNHYFLLESFFNPTPGSRNLEYDPKQKTKAP